MHKTYDAQLGDYWSDLLKKPGETWDSFREDYIDDPLKDLAIKSGMSEKEVDEFMASAGKDAKKELMNELTKAVGPEEKTATTGSSTITEQFTAIQSHPAIAAVPGGIFTIVGGSLLIGYLLFKD